VSTATRISTKPVRIKKDGVLDLIKWSDRISGLIDYAFHRMSSDSGGWLHYTGRDIRRALEEAQEIAGFDLPD
jgi:hypothetical protein